MSRGSAPRCNTCSRPVVFFVSPFAPGKMRPFDPEPVNGRTFQGAGAYPTEGRHAYKYADLVEVLLVRHQYSRAEAEDEVYDVPWYVIHSCRENHPPGGTQ